jgi:adenylate cyclase
MRWALGLIATLLAALHAAGVLPLEAVERADLAIYDWRMRVQAPRLDPRIVIVDIDEKSLAEVGRWPWSRDVVAQLVERLAGQYGAQTIAFDVVFAEPDTSSGYGVLETLGQNEWKDIAGIDARIRALKPRLDYDARLAAALGGRNVVLSFVLSNQPGAAPKGSLPAPAFTEADLDGRWLDATTWKAYSANLAPLQGAAAAAGFDNPLPDADGSVRALPLVAQFGDGYYESLALATARVALGASALRPVFLRPDQFWLGEQARREYGAPAGLALNTAPRETRIPVERRLSALVDYRGRGGPDGGAFRYVPAADVLKGRLAAEALRGRIALVGTTVPGLHDLRATPVSPNFPGVEIHANAIASILDGHFKQRPDFSAAAELLQLALAGLLLAIALPRLKPAQSIALAAGAALCATGFNFWLYHAHGYVLPLAATLLLVLALSFLDLAYGYWFEYRKRRAIARRFGEYVAPELVERMAEDPERYRMEGDSRELTVLFADVRDFTAISEKMSPQALRQYLNPYLSRMSEDIRAGGGTLDKYMGDAVMAFWGAPLEQADHAERAVAAALRMQASAQALDAEFRRRGMPPLKIGIGINTGQMHVGDMGSAIRLAYTVIGDAVNLGARLEGLTKVYGAGIVVSESTRLAAPRFAYRELDRVRVKGRSLPAPVFQPLGWEHEVGAEVREAAARWHAALERIRARAWDEAEAMLRELQRAAPDDGLVALYLQRLAGYRQEPPPPDWDGATGFDRK